MVTQRLTTALKVLFSSQAHVTFQHHSGEEPHTLGFGHGDIKDLVLFSRAMKQSYDGFLNMINEMAAETGDLHTLTQLREALDTLEATDGGDS